MQPDLIGDKIREPPDPLDTVMLRLKNHCESSMKRDSEWEEHVAITAAAIPAATAAVVVVMALVAAEGGGEEHVAERGKDVAQRGWTTEAEGRRR